jgi:hypothetical protein
MDDIKRRRPYYKSDWTDGLSQKSISASLFLFFTCLAPVVAFGGLTNIMTSGTMGVIEFILSCGISGMIYAMFSGQPMAFVGPTGLTLAFISALYNFTKAKGLVFLPLYCWTGIWTSAILAMFSVFNVSNLISYCTTFTDDVFNALLALNFIYEALSNLIQNFSDPLVPAATAFTSMNIALGTWFATRKVVNTGTKSRLVSKRFRQLCVDFGPTVVIVAMTLFSATPFVRAQSISYLSVATKFQLAAGRGWFPDLMSVPVKMRFACILPALLLSMLFYLDQNITVRTTEASLKVKPQRKGRKGYVLNYTVLFLFLSYPFCFVRDVSVSLLSIYCCLLAFSGTAWTESNHHPPQSLNQSIINRHNTDYFLPNRYYHQDMMVLAVITGTLSVLGLPWVCAATVQSLNHVRACSGTYSVTIMGFADHTDIFCYTIVLPLLLFLFVMSLSLSCPSMAPCLHSLTRHDV